MPRLHATARRTRPARGRTHAALHGMARMAAALRRCPSPPRGHAWGDDVHATEKQHTSPAMYTVKGLPQLMLMAPVASVWETTTLRDSQGAVDVRISAISAVATGALCYGVSRTVRMLWVHTCKFASESISSGAAQQLQLERRLHDPVTRSDHCSAACVNWALWGGGGGAGAGSGCSSTTPSMRAGSP